MAVHLDEFDPHLIGKNEVWDEEGGPTAGHVPPMDIVERPDDVEIRVDVAVAGRHLRIAGFKRPPCSCAPGSAAFHVAERTFGHFARTIALRRAFDASAIRATLAQGELRIVVPRLEERRGREIEIPIETVNL
jgi:HSP20 family molecular chaperone IbpA